MSIDGSDGVTLNASITTSGGAAYGYNSASGGEGGAVSVDGYYGVTLNAAITSTGGYADSDDSLARAAKAALWRSIPAMTR